MIYTKITGTVANAEALLLLLRTNLVNFGWTEEFYGDNIISAVNLGKKLIMKKGLIYTYFAASDNNNPTGNTASFVTNNISCLKFCCSLNLNTANNWFANNSNGVGANQASGIQFSGSRPYTLYINNDNFILVSNFATGLYSTMFVGNTTRNCFFANGSISGVDLSGTRLRNKILFHHSGNDGIPTVFKNSVYVNYLSIDNNNFKTLTTTSSYNTGFPAYMTYRATSSTLLNAGHINRASSVLYNTSMIFDLKYYELKVTGRYSPIFYLEDVGLVNFKDISSTPSERENINIGIETYDFIPFLQKESTQIYSNNETWGCGFSVRIG